MRAELSRQRRVSPAAVLTNAVTLTLGGRFLSLCFPRSGSLRLSRVFLSFHTALSLSTVSGYWDLDRHRVINNRPFGRRTEILQEEIR